MSNPYKTIYELRETIAELSERYREQEAEIEELLKEREWISVKDRLPEVGEHVLVFSPITGIKNDFVAFGENHEEHRFFLSGIVTHWMPLPELPP